MRVLVVEDDPALGAHLVQALEAAGFAVQWERDGVHAEFAGQTEDFDAAVLDLGLPGMDGVSVLRAWRDAGRQLPVIVLTARGQWHDKLAGFGAGADDYLVKPLRLDELVLRVRAVVRRAAGHAHGELRCGALHLDVATGAFTWAGAPLGLTAQEYRILAYLLHHAGRVVSRSELGEHVYAHGFDSDSNVLDVLISRIRRKLGEPLLHTVRGRGFMLQAPS